MTEETKEKKEFRRNFACIGLTFFLLFAGWSFVGASSLSTEATNAVAAVTQQSGYVITGTVVDNLGEELIGVAVQLRSDMTVGRATDIDGNFSIPVPSMNDVLVFTFIGMATQELQLVAGTTHYRVVMLEDAAVLEAVVVEAGFFVRDQATATGAARTIGQEELRSVGSINVLQSLRTLDPNFVMIENLDVGSDPNRMPAFELRGRTGIDLVGVGQEETNVNMPLFIIDGFEATIEEVNDLDIARIESVTLLMDAGSTAIFGARGANGVILIQTVRPAHGRVHVHYTGNFEFSWADLSQYNMMNAREKLEFEVLAGFFNFVDNPANDAGLVRYRVARRRVEMGIDTDWMRLPVRLGLTQNHSVNVTGGDGAWLFTTGLNYRNVQGVMRDSSRETYGGNIRIAYRGVQNLNISNNLTVSGTNARDGGWGSFSNFVRANPYMSPFDDEHGTMLRFLDAGRWDPTEGVRIGEVANPLWNASLFSFSDNLSFTLTNNTNMNWQILPNLRVEGNLSLRHSTSNNTTFLDPRNTSFATLIPMRRGTYTESNSRSFRYVADARVSYGILLNDVHNFTFVGRTAIEDAVSENSVFVAEGFPERAPAIPSFAYSYRENSRPSFRHNQSRSVSAMVAINYNYLARYLLDFTVNREGSNTFGSEHLFATVWSAGAGWNVHREEFARDWRWLSELRIRTTYGTSANQGARHTTTNVYGFHPGSDLFGTAATLIDRGNPHLQWMLVENLSGGIDIALNNPRLRANFDLFRRTSNPLVVRIPQKASTGVGGDFPMNFGMMETVGYTFRLNYSPIHNTRERRMLTFTVSGGANRSRLDGFGDLMDFLNRELFNHTDATVANMLQRWEDGSSPDAMWAVPSLGIDPATGQEIFLKRDGTHTFTFDQADRVVMGNSRPVIEGIIGVALTHRQLQANLNFRYRLGGYIFNSVLFDRVENLSAASLRYNQDRRALHDRWQRPGDIAQFRGITLHQGTRMSSRFLQRENRLTGESVNLVWNFDNDGWIQQLGLQRLNAGVSMRDIFYLSNIKAERGISFPFARSVTFNINATF